MSSCISLWWRWVCCLPALLALRPVEAPAQTPSWQAAQAISPLLDGDYSLGATAFGPDGSCYYAGSFTGTIQVGEARLMSTHGQTLFVTKYDLIHHQVQWVQQLGSTGTCQLPLWEGQSRREIDNSSNAQAGIASQRTAQVKSATEFQTGSNKESASLLQLG